MRTQTTWNAWRFFRFSLLWLALSAMWTALLSIVLPEMADHYAARSGQYGRGQILALLSGAGAAVSALTQVLVGWKSDSDPGAWRRWKFMLIGLPLTAIPLYLLGRSSSLPEVVLALLLLQLTANMATGPYQALIPDAVPAQRHGAASTWMGLFQHGGQILGPVLAMLLLGEQLSGLGQLEAVVFAGLMIGLFCLWTALPPGAPPRTGVVRAGLKQAISSMLGGERSFQLLIQSRLVINIGFYLVVNFLLFYVRYSLGYDSDRHDVTTQLLGCMVIGGLLGGVMIGPLADRRAKKPLLYGSCAVTAVGMVGFVMAPTQGLALASFFAALAGFGFGGFSVVDWSLACNLAPRASSALSMGVWNLAAVLPQIIAPGLFGPLSDALTSSLGAQTTYRVVMGAVVLFLGLGCGRLVGLEEKPHDKLVDLSEQDSEV